MFQALSLRTKLLLLGGVGILPVVVVVFVVLQLVQQTSQAAAHECAGLSSSDLDHTVLGISALCLTQQENLVQMLDTGLKVAQRRAGSGRWLQEESGE